MLTDTTVDNTIEIHPLIKERRSLRAYNPDKEVSDEALQSLFEAARWSPSAFNEQPWRYIYARRGSEAYEKMYQTILDGNKPWAGNAPVLVLVIAKVNSSYNDSHNRHAFHDLGLAMGMFTIQATSIGLNLHQMGGFNQREVEELFEIPSGFEAVSITSVGYTGSPDLLPEVLRQRETAPRVRKPVDEFAFENHWKY